MQLLLVALPILAAAQGAGPVSLFDGKSLAGWHIDAPELDAKPDGPKPFVVRRLAPQAQTEEKGPEFALVSLGAPTGHLITDATFENYRLTVEYRFTKQLGNCGVLVHASKPRAVGNWLPQSLEVQMMAGNAGDFYLLGETIKQRGWTSDASGRRLPNFTDNSEKPQGQWNSMVVECREDAVKVWVNGDLVNDGYECSARKGQIALQSEGVEVEFRKLDLRKLADARRT